MRRAIAEALQRDTPRASSVAFLLRKQQPTSPSAAPKVDLSRYPEVQYSDVQAHDLETYDELARHDHDPDE